MKLANDILVIREYKKILDLSKVRKNGKPVVSGYVNHGSFHIAFLSRYSVREKLDLLIRISRSTTLATVPNPNLKPEEIAQILRQPERLTVQQYKELRKATWHTILRLGAIAIGLRKPA